MLYQCMHLYHKSYRYIHTHTHTHIYIYNLLNTSTYGKKKKTASNLKIKIYNELLSRGKKIYIYWKKKEKANLVIPIEKNQHIRNWLVKRK